MVYSSLIRFKHLILIFCLLGTVSLQAQNIDTTKKISPVLVTNHAVNNRQVIMVKWITDALIYPSGVNVYRQELGELTWVKLNQQPLVKGMFLPTASEYNADSTLRQYIEMAKSLKITDLKEFVKVYVLIKSVQSEGFARYLGIQITDSTVSNGRNYRYKVIELTRSGENTIGYSDYIQVDRFKPDAPPSGIDIKALDQTVLINWIPDDLRFHGVNVYRSSSKDTVAKKINSVPLMISKRELPNGDFKYPDIFFTDSRLTNKVKYTYQIAGVDFFGRETRLSEKITVMPGDRKPPLAPFSLRCRVNKYSVKLSWLNQYTADQEGINIYRSYKTDNYFIKINSSALSVNDTTYIDKDLKPGYYYYMIAAVDSAGNEGRSAKMLTEVHDITPPAIPQNVVAVADTGRIVLSWDTNLEPDLLGYQIYRTIDNDKQDFYVLLNAKPFYANSFVDSLPLNARNFFVYKVTAVDSSLNRSGYSIAAKTRMPDITPPVQPVIIGVNPKDDYLAIEWIPNFETDLAGYDLYRHVDSLHNRTKLNVGLLSPATRRFTDRSISPDSLYYYTLQAVDSSGNRSRLSDPFACILSNNISNKAESEILQLAVKKPLFSKTIRIQWKIKRSETFIGSAVYRRISPDGDSKRLNNLNMENSYVDSDKFKPTAQYQLRLYHSNGSVVKSEWVSKQ